MPLYQYECTKCHHSDEYLMKMSESDIALECEKCGADMHRVIGDMHNQLVKWTRRYRDEQGQETVVPCSPPGGKHGKTSYRKGHKYGKGKFYIVNKKTGEVEEA